MKTEIYYFTGTGNSLYIAGYLTAAIEHSELFSISEMIQHPVIKANAERVGFVFPVYYGGLPEIVEAFIRKIDLKAAETIFYIHTSGDDDNGFDCSTGKIKRILSGKGKELNGGYNISMPGNYIKMYEPESEEEKAAKLKESKDRIKNITIQILSARTEVKPDKSGLISKIINNIWQKFVFKSDKSFFTTESCNSCGICAKVCPVDNIQIADSKPEWRHRCQECLACIHYCPRLAIQTKNTIDRVRYHHPEVSVNKMIRARKK